MLFIQTVHLTWSKKEKSQKCAEIRNKVSKAYSMQYAKIPENLKNTQVLLDTITLIQRGVQILPASQYYIKSCCQSKTTAKRKRPETEGYYTKKGAYSLVENVENIKIPCIALRATEDFYQVKWYYDDAYWGAPFRRGHNEEYLLKTSGFYGKDIVNETAFYLKEGEYGRLLYNCRKTGYETGEWYYEQYCINCYSIDSRAWKENLFVSREPDYFYQQMEDLY